MNFATASGSATSPSDFLGASGTLTFAAGQTSRQVTVVVNGDTNVEGNETFSVNLTGGVNVTVAGGSGVGTILDDDFRSLYVTGADAGGGPHVRVFEAETGVEKFGFLAYASNFTGGVRVAAGDVNGDGAPDIATAPGRTGGPHVRVFDGRTGQIIHDFFAFETAFDKGVQLAMADVTGDGRADIIVGTDGDPGDSLSRVRVFDGLNASQLQQINLTASTGLNTGVRVAAGDIDDDGRADLILGSSAGVASRVTVLTSANLSFSPIVSFQPYGGFTGGVYVAAGDANGDGETDIYTGAGAGGGPHVMVFNGQNSSNLLASFFAYGPTFTGGVRVASTDYNRDGAADIVTAAGPGGGPHVRILSGVGLQELHSFFAYRILHRRRERRRQLQGSRSSAASLRRRAGLQRRCGDHSGRRAAAGAAGHCRLGGRRPQSAADRSTAKH